MQPSASSKVPSRLITIFILCGTLLSGSLINTVPTLNDFLNITAIVHNCTDLVSPLTTTQSQSLLATDNLWTLLMPIFLPVIYIFIVDGSFTLDPKKIKSLYQHCTGQIMSFSSSEIIRHFIVSPNLNFPLKCNLTETECQNPLNEITNTSQLCHNSTYSTKEIFDSLHSIPNATAALMGSSSVFLLHHLKSNVNTLQYSPFAEINHPLCSKYKIFSQQLWKTLCLCVFFATIYFCLWQTFKANTATMQELLFSFGYGAIVQFTVQKNKKYNNVIVQTSTPSAPTPPLTESK